MGVAALVRFLCAWKTDRAIFAFLQNLIGFVLSCSSVFYWIFFVLSQEANVRPAAAAYGSLTELQKEA